MYSGLGVPFRVVEIAIPLIVAIEAVEYGYATVVEDSTREVSASFKYLLIRFRSWNDSVMIRPARPLAASPFSIPALHFDDISE
jgi:hypothetical protein